MSPGAPAPGLPIRRFETDADWAAWLGDNHAASRGIWLTFAKKTAAVTTVTYPQALEVAICFGWIDGQRRGLDESFFLTRFTPRGPRSRWSQINRDKATELIAAGRMRPSGLAQVQAAQADGRWEAAYEPQASATVPDDLRAALDADPAAAQFFATLTGVRRYAFLYRLHHVTRPAARAKRIAGYIELLREGRTLN
ncbi:MAG: YdeI/OmpD-associated family protein [Solirubrobacteraceae bacterium]